MIKRGKLMRACLFSVLTFAAFCAVSSVQASTVVVGSCKSGLTQFSTIQAAVNSAPTGSTIDICPGTYPEQVTITKKLTLIGVESGTSDAAVILPPSTGLIANNTDLFGSPVAAQIFVENATGVTISHLTVDGTGNNVDCGSLEGIHYQNASGTITDNTVRNQIQATDQGCQDGLAIKVENNVETAVITISNNSVHNYEKNGITAHGTGTGAPAPNVAITGNTIVGVGATPQIAQNGIEVAFGATGKVMGNYVADDIYTPASNASVGILIYASPGVVVSGNTIESTQLGISIESDPTFGSADGASVTTNHIGGTQNFDAIDLCSNNDIAESNVIYGSSQSGIHSDGECTEPEGGSTGSGNTITKNTVNEACAGILTGPNSGTFSPNTYFNVTNTTLAGDSCPAAGAGVGLKAGESSEKHQSSRPLPAKK